MWISRDSQGELHFSINGEYMKEIASQNDGYYDDYAGDGCSLGYDLFPGITPANSPVEVELKIK